MLDVVASSSVRVRGRVSIRVRVRGRVKVRVSAGVPSSTVPHVCYK